MAASVDRIGPASELIRAGRFAEARQVVDAAASGHMRDGNGSLAAACLRLGAVLSRLIGDDLGATSREARANPVGGEAIPTTPTIDRQAAKEAVAAARTKVEGDHVGLSQLAMLDVALHLEEGDVNRALRSAQTVQAEALSGGAPVEYLAATVAIAELADRTDDRARAYRVMAVALVTLGDVVGIEVARRMAEPELLELRRRWGAGAFATIKAEYEQSRRERASPNTPPAR
jgi:hypothetical protein